MEYLQLLCENLYFIWISERICFEAHGQDLVVTMLLRAKVGNNFGRLILITILSTAV